MLSCSILFSAPSFWMGGGLESRCVGRVYGADGAVHGTIRTTLIIMLTKPEAKLELAKLEVSSTVLLKILVFLDATTCRLVNNSRRFGKA